MVLKSNNGWNGHKDQTTYRQWLLIHIDELNQLAKKHDAGAIKEKLTQIVPEYQIDYLPSPDTADQEALQPSQAQAL